MTEKENYLKVLRHEKAEWVPNYFDAVAAFPIEPVPHKVIPGSGDPNKTIIDWIGFPHKDRERYVNWLGVEYTVTVDGAMATPNSHIMTDITKWREQISYPFPDLDKVDFQAQANMIYSMVNHDEKAFFCVIESVFLALINTMGVAEALCAMMEEPEAVKDFFKELTDYQEKMLRMAAVYFKPEGFLLCDDVATAREMFMSPQAYDELIAPYHRQIAKAALDLGIFAEMHCCGKCERLIPRWIDMGYSIWQPAQPVNDLIGIQKKYGDKLVLNGCWDNAGEGGITGAPEEVVRRSVRETIDQFAPGGGFVFWDTGRTGGDFDKFTWTADEANKYGKSFYKNHILP